MKNKLLTIGLFTGIFLTACNNQSSEKKQNATTYEPPEANVTSTTTAGAPTVANAPVVNSAVGEDPEKVVQKIFDAAKSGDFSTLKDLCDPTGNGDGDTKDICSMASQTKKVQDDFVNQFKNGSIDGEAVIEADVAVVKIKFGPTGTKNEKIELKKIMGNWYLSDF